MAIVDVRGQMANAHHVIVQLDKLPIYLAILQIYWPNR